MCKSEHGQVQESEATMAQAVHARASDCAFQRSGRSRCQGVRAAKAKAAWRKLSTLVKVAAQVKGATVRAVKAKTVWRKLSDCTHCVSVQVQGARELRV